MSFIDTKVTAPNSTLPKSPNMASHLYIANRLYYSHKKAFGHLGVNGNPRLRHILLAQTAPTTKMQPSPENFTSATLALEEGLETYWAKRISGAQTSQLPRTKRISGINGSGR